MNVGAVSLILNFPSDKIQVQGVYLGNDPNAAVPYEVHSNELLISWHSLAPVSLQAGDRLLTLQLSMDASSDDELYFSLASNPLNELANESYEVIRDARIIMDGIKASALGVNDLNLSGQLTLANHPNPFNGTTSFEYTLPADGRVVLEVYDVIGNKVGVLIDEAQTAGTYVVKEDLSHLQPGYYTVAMKLQSRDHALTRAIKIICK